MLFGTPPSSPLSAPSAAERNLPLILAYVAGPMLAMGSWFLGPDPAWVVLAERGMWLGLAGFGLVRVLLGDAPRPLRRGLPFMAAALLILTALTLSLNWRPPEGARLWLAELSPLAWVGLAVLWGRTVAAPRPRDFLSAGAGLAVAVLADLLLTSLLAWRPMLSGGFFFPPGLDRVETHATLLLAAFAAGQFSGDREREPFRVRLLRGLVLAGLLATFSRTALSAAFCLVLFMGRGSWNRRTLTMTACLAFAALPVVLPELPGLVMERFEARLGWVGFTGAVLDQPSLLLTGVGPGGRLPLILPQDLVMELSLPTAVIRTLPAALTSCWLRILAVWGIWGWLATAGGAAGLLAASWSRARASARFRKGLAVVLMGLFQGLLFPLAFLPAAAVPLLLVLFVRER